MEGKDAASILAEHFPAAASNTAGGDTVKAVVNSRTSGKFRRIMANGRSHVVTGMVPLVGDTVMNSILYPDDEVHKSFEQLNNLPAPAGHPEVEGKRVSAFNPMAVNAHNIGGFVRNPTKTGRKVEAEFWLDEKIAGSTDDGKETLRRIEENEEVGVSTGLTLRLVQGNGTGPDGKDYMATGRDFTFDHVAVLLDQSAAGAHVGTALVTNDGERIITGTVDNVTASELHTQLESEIARRIDLIGDGRRFTWIRDIDLDEDFVIFSVADEDVSSATRLFKMSFEQTETGVSLLGDPQEVTEVTTFVPAEEREPENPNAGEGKMEITQEKATEFLAGLGFTVTNKEEAEAIAAAILAYETDKPAFDAWKAANAEALTTKRAQLVEASELTEAQVSNMAEDVLDNLIALATKTTADNSLRGGNAGGAGGNPGGETVTADDCAAFISAPAKKEG